jgi:two-component sensor histidine kinase
MEVLRSSGSRRLVAENLRLQRKCEEAKETAERYKLMLREGDHRIKNSLQIVASLMCLQERREQNPVAREALHLATARIQAVARIHDALQLNGGKDLVDLGALIATMCETLQAMADEPNTVRIVVNVDPIAAPIALAQPLVLAVNELVVNALRHAFPNGRGGAIIVTLAQISGELRVSVADDGVGLPADYGEGRGYGMRLVKMMVTKIRGAIHVENRAGACFTLCAPMPGSAVSNGAATVA